MPERRKGPRRRRGVRLTVIPKPDASERAILEYEGPGTVVLNGDSPEEPPMVCGACGATLVIGRRPDQFDSVVLRCNGCGAYNDTL